MGYFNLFQMHHIVFVPILDAEDEEDENDLGQFVRFYQVYLIKIHIFWGPKFV